MSVSCRAIDAASFDGVVDCLARNFPRRRRGYWTRALDNMSRLPLVDGYPRYGYALSADERIVGVILLIFARRAAADLSYVQCNISSWCVDPQYRASAILLHLAAVKHKQATFVNVSPAPHTFSTIEALGFRRISNGQILFAPAILAPRAGLHLRRFTADSADASLLAKSEREILADHAALGCVTLVGIRGKQAFPFVLQRRALRRVVLCSQLIYCRAMDEFFEFSPLIGRFLLPRSGPFLLIDAGAPVRGLAGHYFAERNPKYFKGSNPPRIGDLAYTELPVFGP